MSKATKIIGISILVTICIVIGILIFYFVKCYDTDKKDEEVTVGTDDTVSIIPEVSQSEKEEIIMSEVIEVEEVPEIKTEIYDIQYFNCLKILNKGQMSNKQLNDFAIVLQEYGHDIYGLEPSKILALALTESEFNIDAVGKFNRDDKGLFQFNTEWWDYRKDEAILDFRRYDFHVEYYDNYFDPICNLIVTIHYLNNIRKRYLITSDLLFLAFYGLDYVRHTEVLEGKVFMNRFYENLKYVRSICGKM